MFCVANLFYDSLFHGPRAGFNFNDHFGGGTVLTQNLFFDWVQKSTDHGAINFWDREHQAHNHSVLCSVLVSG
jgi:hypothetical protein